MSSLALLIAPTDDGWGVYLTNGEELARYHGIGSKSRAIRFLRRYAQAASQPWTGKS